MANKPASTMVRYCGEVVGDTYCNAKLKRSVSKVNGHYEGVCPRCGRFYLNYNSCSIEPKTGIPRASQITAAKNRAMLLDTEIVRLRATHTGTVEELTATAQKNVAYASAKKVKNSKDSTPVKVKDKSKGKPTDNGKGKNKATKKKTVKRTATSKRSANKAPTVTQDCEIAWDDISDAVAGLDAPSAVAESSYTPYNIPSEDSCEGIEWDKMPEVVSEAPVQTPDLPDTTQANGKFFTRARHNGEDEDFPDILEDVEYETVVLKQPEPINPGSLDAKIDSAWTDVFVSKHNLTASQVKELLLAESALLKIEKFKLDGINFNTAGLDEDTILEQIREKSIMSLMLCGKTSTQNEVDASRAAKIKRDAEVQKAKEEYLVKSVTAAQGLSYNFLSGVMTEEQADEFMRYGLISKKNLKKVPPTPERLYDIVNRKRILASMGKPTTKEIELEVVVEYNDVWKSICSDICNKEFGEHSYWIAAGTSWFIPEYVDDVIKTGFASGLSVVPMVTLCELKAMFEKAHGYLNDMEFLAHSPKAMRDSIERFTMFNAAYSAIYDGATPIFKPKAIETPRYTWEAYMQSDVVVILLPETGLVAGGLAMLGELLRGRAMARKSTILVSTTSMKRLNELNAGLVPALFGQNGIAIVASTEVGPKTYLDTSTYVYYTIHDDRTTKASAVQQRKKRIENNNKL